MGGAGKLLLLLVQSSLLLYLAVLFMNPGYMSTQLQPQDSAKEEQMAMVSPDLPYLMLPLLPGSGPASALPALEPVAMFQWPPVHYFLPPVALLLNGCPAPELIPLPGGSEHHHMGGVAYCNNYLCQHPRNLFDRGLAQNLTNFCWWLSMSWKSLWVEDQEEASSKTA